MLVLNIIDSCFFCSLIAVKLKKNERGLTFARLHSAEGSRMFGMADTLWWEYLTHFSKIFFVYAKYIAWSMFALPNTLRL